MRPLRARTWYLLALGLISIPYALIVAVGSLWLYQHHLLLDFMILSVVVMVASWWILARLREKNRAAAAGMVRPSETWSEAGRRAWQEVDAIARRLQAEDLPLDNPQRLWNALDEVLQTVARHFHPDSPQAVLEIPVPHVLRVAELVAADLRGAFSEYVPGAHILTLRDWQRLGRLATLYRPIYLVYRVVTFGFNPVSALLREARDAAGDKLVNASASEVKKWAIGYCARKAGFYAIQLYSGHLVLEGVEFAAYQTPQAKRDVQTAHARQERLAEEPLRVLVLGQVKSGKSSLINALFGEARAAVDIVPTTRGVEPYWIEREGLPRAIVLDTAGYEAVEGGGNVMRGLEDEALDCDLLLMVCSARSASRGADRRLLDHLRRRFRQSPDRPMPPLVVVLTHVDQLRPIGQWNPPYDLSHPSDEKARNIRDALDAVAEDLQLGPDEAVVPVCLKPEQLYNVAEALAPAILQVAPEAQRAKFLRCLRQVHKEDYWQRLWQQALNAGRLVLRAARRKPG